MGWSGWWMDRLQQRAELRSVGEESGEPSVMTIGPRKTQMSCANSSIFFHLVTFELVVVTFHITLKNGMVVIITVWLYQFHLWDPLLSM